MLGLLGNFAGPDMLIIFIVILLLFGAKKLPELARGMGQAVKEFSKAKDSLHDELNRTAVADSSPTYHSDPHHADAHPSQGTTAAVSPTIATTTDHAAPASTNATSTSETAQKPNA